MTQKKKFLKFLKKGIFFTKKLYLLLVGRHNSDRSHQDLDNAIKMFIEK